ncbi:MAG: molybdenum cofactor guanylyltransferase [Firmicutes bacterium]|nr:molybdenum cofactor guanylyltransferase [Dethiobacter sp.]MBS3889431.1 molybdenum cofactor guanylyltransferase [Bacillota bacterium]MBS4053365.1 molybdenum cofactor guanylyltransferase [Thermaerobacter sp.]
MEETGTAIILAGGLSTRMGFSKEALLINGERLLYSLHDTLRRRFEQIIVVSNTLEDSEKRMLEVVRDELVGLGPLGGIHAGLKTAKSRYSYVLACDMPYLNMDYVSFLQGRLPPPDQEISALVTALGCHMEPFNGFYNRSLVDPIRVFAATGQKSLTAFLRSQSAVLVDEDTARRFSPDWSMFANINTPADMLALTGSLATKGGRTHDRD